MRINNKGYSILEALVVVFIVASIAGLVLVNYRAGESSSDLNLAANKLASDIRLAQSYAMSQKEYNSVRSEDGWGVYLDKTSGNNTSYIIYAERPIASGNYEYNGNFSNEGYMQIDLPNDIIIESISLDYSNINNLSIGFEPPDPITYFNDDASTNNLASTTLKDLRTGASKSVIVNLFGLIDVD